MAERDRAECIRDAVKDRLFQRAQERMEEAYRLQPDSPEDAGGWDLPEEWKDCVALNIGANVRTS